MSILSILSLAFSWGKSNCTGVAITLLAIVLAFGGWRYTKLVRDYANSQQIIELQKQAIADKEKALQNERELAKLQVQALEEQAIELAKLQAQLENITDNLGNDAGDLAPESIREILRRLGAL